MMKEFEIISLVYALPLEFDDTVIFFVPMRCDTDSRGL